MNERSAHRPNAGTFDRLRRNQTCLRGAKTAIVFFTFAVLAACSNGPTTSNGYSLMKLDDLPVAEADHGGRSVARCCANDQDEIGLSIRSNGFVPWTMYGDPAGRWHIELADRIVIDSATAWASRSTSGDPATENEVTIETGHVATATVALAVYRYSAPVLPVSVRTFHSGAKSVATIEGESGTPDVALIRNPSNVILIVGHSPSTPFDGAHLLGPGGEVLHVIAGLPLYPDQVE